MVDNTARLYADTPSGPALLDIPSTLSAGLPTAQITATGDTVPKTMADQIAGRARIGRTAVANVNYTVSATDATVGYTSLTASRVVTLPAASAYPIGQNLVIVDETGACATTRTITVAASGTDTIAGQATLTLNAAYQRLVLQTNGAKLWTLTLNSVPSSTDIQRQARTAAFIFG